MLLIYSQVMPYPCRSFYRRAASWESLPENPENKKSLRLQYSGTKACAPAVPPRLTLRVLSIRDPANHASLITGEEPVGYYPADAVRSALHSPFSQTAFLPYSTAMALCKGLICLLFCITDLMKTLYTKTACLSTAFFMIDLSAFPSAASSASVSMASTAGRDYKREETVRQRIRALKKPNSGDCLFPVSYGLKTGMNRQLCVPAASYSSVISEWNS